MRRTLISIMCMTVAFMFAASCNKIDDDTVSVEGNGRTVINGVAEAIGGGTKAYNEYCYIVKWDEGDQIWVTDGTKDDTFTLTDGEDTPTGVFTEDNEKGISGNIEAFYPASLKTDDGYVWPATQTNNQVPPMYAKQSITDAEGEIVTFSSLGAMLQIVLTTTDSDITLSSIRISDATKPLSGYFSVSDGKAVMAGSGKNGIVLNAGNIPIGNAAKYFNIAVPAGKYDNLKLTFLTNDDKGVAMYSTTMPEIQHNTVARISLCAKNFKPAPTGFALDLTTLSLPVGGHHRLLPQFTPSDTYNKKVRWSSSNPAVATIDADGMVKAIATGSTTITAQLEDETLAASCSVTVISPAAPADALGGLFSVSDNKVVRFAKSNLCKKSDGSFIFFERQYDMAQGEEMTELMGWDELSTWLSSSDGQGWQMLSADEWKYLIGENQFRKGLYANHVTVVGVEDCLIIYPDGYAGTKVTDENRTTLYNDSSTWAQANNDGVVCLTPAKESGFARAYYWISQDRMFCSNDDENLWVWNHSGNGPFAARPVTEFK